MNYHPKQGTIKGEIHQIDHTFVFHFPQMGYLTLDIKIPPEKVFKVCFCGPNTFSGGVWMSRVMIPDISHPFGTPPKKTPRYTVALLLAHWHPEGAKETKRRHHNANLRGQTWRIIPCSKWFITMVSKSPK